MDNRVQYRSARQESYRKALIAKVWAIGRERGWDKSEMYEAICALGKAKMIHLYKYNWVGRGESSRVSLSSLKLWQLKQVVEGLVGKSDRVAKKPVAKVLDREEWAHEREAVKNA